MTMLAHNIKKKRKKKKKNSQYNTSTSNGMDTNAKSHMLAFCPTVGGGILF